MKIEMWPIEKIKPYPGNPRMNDAAVEAVAKSLREFGWRQPIVVDEDGVIIVGHTRHKAALFNQYPQVPVHVAKDLTPAQAKAYRIADNATAAIAEWDKELLPLELGELQDMDFDLSLLGFEEEELAAFMSGDVEQGLNDIFDPTGHCRQCGAAAWCRVSVIALGPKYVRENAGPENAR